MTILRKNYNRKKRHQNLIHKFGKIWFLSFCLFVYSLDITLGHVDVDLTGLSYHIGGSSTNPAHTGAPRKLDDNGVFVFNPGIGIGYDFRNHWHWKSLSPIVKGIYFKDCDNRGFFILGGGCRYRYFFSERISADINAMVSIAWGQQWDKSEYATSILPLILIGPNYHFKNEIILGANFTLAPRNTSFDATGSFWILFTTLQVSFPIF